MGPPKGSNRLYIPPGVTLEQLQDVTIPLAVVEGEKKALALRRLACHETDKPQFILCPPFQAFGIGAARLGEPMGRKANESM